MAGSRQRALVLLAVALSTGCVVGPGTGGSLAAGHETRAFGAAADVLDTVAAVKSAGAVRAMSSRAIRLPARALEPLTTFEYRYAARCGGHAFRVIESGDTQILEYRHSLADGTEVHIRDYVAGPQPFIAPGVWGAFDHTADGVGEMSSEFVEMSTTLLPTVYSKGLVTTLAGPLREQLGAAYRAALVEVRSCPP